jgi:hypothetical protein
MTQANLENTVLGRGDKKLLSLQAIKNYNPIKNLKRGEERNQLANSADLHGRIHL